MILQKRFRSLLHLVLVAAVVVFGAHAADTANSPRYDKLSHKIMCTCGCNQLLGECNHVGCPNLEKMGTQLAGKRLQVAEQTALALHQGHVLGAQTVQPCRALAGHDTAADDGDAAGHFAQVGDIP